MVEINNKTRSKIDIKRIETAVNKFFVHYKVKEKQVSIALVGDKTIRELNKKYRGIDRPTDILTFSGEEDFLGEIVIDLAQVKRQAKTYSKTTADELNFILVHGMLHLLGYDDKTEKDRLRMLTLGEKFIKTNIKK